MTTNFIVIMMMMMMMIIIISSNRLVSGMPPENGAYETTSCWLTTMKRATVLSSSRQAIKEFVFDTRKRIGLEVEIINDVVSMGR